MNAAKQIRESSLNYAGPRRAIDIVRDVANITPISWLAERFALPIKTPEHPRGVFTIPQLFEIYQVVAMYQKFNVFPMNEWKLRAGADEGATALREILELHLKVRHGGFTEKIADYFEKDSAFEVGAVADRLYHALNATKKPVDDLVEECISFAAPIASTITQQTSLLIDLFLSPGYETYKERIVELSHRDDEASARELQGFVYEAMRHAGIGPGLARTPATDSIIQDGSRGPVTVKSHQKVLAATSIAAMDPAAFPSPEQLNPNRSMDLYAVLLGTRVSKIAGPAIAAILKEVFKLPNIRRAQGRPGRFTIVGHDFAGIKIRTYLDSNARESTYPTNLMLEYEEEVPKMNGMVNGVH